MNQSWKNTAARFLTAQTISLFGSSLVQYAIVWYVTLSTSSGRMLTISTVCGFAPQIAISLFAGVWIDRYDRKMLIMLSDTVIALSTLILAIAFLSGRRNIWLLFAVLMIRSAGTGIQTPAVNAVIPQIVPQGHLMRVNGIQSTITALIMFLSPAVSGAILSVSTLETTLFIDVFTALIGVGITSVLAIPGYRKDRMEDHAGTSSGISSLKQGFLYLKTDSFVRHLLLFQIAVLFLISPSAFLTPLMVSRTFGPQVWRLTASEMTYSIGSVLGGILITSWGGFKKRLKTTVLAGWLYGVLMAGLGMAPAFLIYLACNMMIGITSPCYNSPITVSIQEQVPASMQGRVFSFMQISTSCALPLGMMVFGPLADVVRIQTLLIGGGVAVMACTAAFYFAIIKKTE
ncbi:MFS transporter [Lachnoclostridium pacaense]|uniref:MFS transporter n=1 Tax=Enterocloster hominis (ex Hitch et al. 2024) TaxID=1917870 RepID=UPI001D121978|nr:MFS transporter [Lachnoclostridium pacaense]MCC2818002.1 MFS transporter [Lachnoclostridium pacaense]